MRILLLAAALSAGCALSSDTDNSEASDEQQNAQRAQQAPSAPPSLDTPRTDKTTQETSGNKQPAHDLREFLVERAVDPVTWFTGGLLLLGFFQYLAMRQQAKHMADGLTETRASIAEASRAATAMEGIAASMKAQADSLQESIVISREIAGASAQANQTTRALQRARIGLRNIQIQGLPNNGVRIVYDLFNTGPSVAYPTRIGHETHFYVTLPDPIVEPPWRPSGGVLQSNEALSIEFKVLSVSDQQAEMIKSGARFWIIGRIEYRDVFDELHVRGYAVGFDGTPDHAFPPDPDPGYHYET